MSPHGIMTASWHRGMPRHRSLASASQPERVCNTRKTNLHTNSHTSTTFSTNSVVDSGFMVDLGVYSAPDQPHNPDPPRSSGYRTQYRALEEHETHGPQQ